MEKQIATIKNEDAKKRQIHLLLGALIASLKGGK
jgi:hypothetical protein